MAFQQHGTGAKYNKYIRNPSVGLSAIKTKTYDLWPIWKTTSHYYRNSKRPEQVQAIIYI